MPTPPISDLIRMRFSCRSYRKDPLDPALVSALEDFIQSAPAAPFGSPLRFILAAATDAERGKLRELGTYGTIRSPSAFIIGAARPGTKNMEDYGYVLESIVLRATGLGIGTCWIGGFFTRSSFARHIQAAADEVLPAVISAGIPADASRAFDLFRLASGSAARLPWETLFFDETFTSPLTPLAAGEYAAPLEMLRLAPSASNKQPWRVLRQGRAFHFFLRRTPGYGKDSLAFRLRGLADLQRVDMGIAMCHFELSARELGLAGAWQTLPPSALPPADGLEHAATWESG